MLLEDLQKKFETQAAVAELLKMFRIDVPTEGSSPEPSATLLKIHMQAPQQLQQQVQERAQQLLTQQLQLQQQAQEQGALAQEHGMRLPLLEPQQSARDQRYQMRPYRPDPNQCLSVEREWDKVRRASTRQAGRPQLCCSGWVSVTILHSSLSHHAGPAHNDSLVWCVRLRTDLVHRLSARTSDLQDAGISGGAVSGKGGAAPGSSRRRTKNQKNVDQRRRERSRYERYMDVETFWRSTTEDQRMELLQVPMTSLLHGARR